MGSTPAKVDRIIARDTQTTWPDPWSNVKRARPGTSAALDLGSANAPPPLEHRDSGVGWSLILLAFVGASPQNIYSFVSAINIQMWLNIIYSP